MDDEKNKPRCSINITAVITVVSVIVAISSTVIAFQARKDVRSAAAVATFLELRHRFYDIRTNLPSEYWNPDYIPVRESEEWNSIKAYWYQSFDEWFVTQRLDRGAFGTLWDKYYADAINEGLELKAFRTVFCDMAQSEFESGTPREFVAVIITNYRRSSRQEPCSSEGS